MTMTDGAGLSDFDRLALLPVDERDAVLAALGDDGCRWLLADWQCRARPEQLPPQCDWRVWLVMAGRGFGKTRCGAEWVREQAERNPAARIAIVGATLHEARTVMVEGESGILAACAGRMQPDWHPSRRMIRWPDGATAHVYGAAEAESLRGAQHSHGWCDEIAKWSRGETAWHNLVLGMRLGTAPRIVVTTTPRPTRLMRQLLNQADVVVTRGRTQDNRANLPPAFLERVLADYGGSRIGRQELDGELVEDHEDALWSAEMIARCRSKAVADDEMPALQRIIIGVDPPASAHGDACGIIAAGIGGDGSVHVLEDASVERAHPERWARAAAACAARWQADRVVAEANNGGAMVESVLRAADVSLPVRLVHASRGKVARAEPVAALYEQGRVLHRGVFSRLEDELCGLRVGGAYDGPGRSPDRADALVWAVHALALDRTAWARVRVL